MYVVKDENNRVVALCSRPEDAQAWINSNLDNVTYIVEKQGLTDQSNATRQNQGVEKN